MTGEGATADSREVPAAPVAAPEMYRIAYEHGVRTLDDQRDELDGARGRAAQFMAFVGSATAFLVGAGLRSPDRDAAFYTLAIVGTVLVIAALTSLVVVLFPRWNFELTMDPGRLVEKWIDRQVPARPTEADILRALAQRSARMIVANEAKLSWIRRCYLATVISGTLALLSWAILVWMRA